jgi:hypothetical protein
MGLNLPGGRGRRARYSAGSHALCEADLQIMNAVASPPAPPVGHGRRHFMPRTMPRPVLRPPRVRPVAVSATAQRRPRHYGRRSRAGGVSSTVHPGAAFDDGTRRVSSRRPPGSRAVGWPPTRDVSALLVAVAGGPFAGVAEGAGGVTQPGRVPAAGCGHNRPWAELGCDRQRCLSRKDSHGGPSKIRNQGHSCTTSWDATSSWALTRSASHR